MVTDLFSVASTHVGLDQLQQWKQEQENVLKEGSIHFTGKRYLNYTQNPVTIESVSKFKDRASKGELENANFDAVVEWYDFISTKPHVHDFYYYYEWSDGKIKKIISAPPKTMYPWAASLKLIINGVYSFDIDHPLRIVRFSDGDYGKFDIIYNQYFDPIASIYPLLRIDRIEDIDIVNEDAQGYDITYARNNQTDVVDHIYARLSKQYNGASTRTIIKVLMPDNSKEYDGHFEDSIKNSKYALVYIAECSNFVVGDHVYPNDMTIYLFNQNIAPGYASSMLPHDFDWSKLNLNEIENQYVTKWIVNTKDFKLENLGFEEDHFWFNAPEGYTYNDSRMENINRLREGLANIHDFYGSGPHVFLP